VVVTDDITMLTRAYVSPLCALLVLSLPLPCFAQTAEDTAPKDQCGVAFEAAQRLQTQGKLRESQAKLIECSQSTCPAFLVRECVAVYDRVTASIPTITLVARDEVGNPLTEVAVSVDGASLAGQIDGRAFSLDPGVHDFRFDYQGKVVNVRQLLSEGEKNKPVVAEFVLQAPQPGPATQPDDGTKPAQSKGGGVPTATYILGGVGIAALGGGIVMRLIAADNYNELVDTCSPNCSSGKVADVRTQYVISSVGFGVGAAAIVGAGLIWAFGSGGSGSEPDQAGLMLTPVVSRHGAFAVLQGKL
jgi:hypothetical protein